MPKIDEKKILRYHELSEQKEKFRLKGEDVPPKIVDEMSWIKSQCTQDELRELSKSAVPTSP